MIERLQSVRVRNGAFHYDLGRDQEGKRRSEKDGAEVHDHKGLACCCSFGKGMLELALNEASMSGKRPSPQLKNEAEAIRKLTDSRAKLLAALGELADTPPS